MLDRLFWEDLLVRCYIGVSDEERRERQDVLIDVDLWADLGLACRTDSFADTVDYRALKKQILREAEGSKFHLVESLAEHVAQLCLADTRVVRVRVRVQKPGALRFARTVGVEIVRERAG